ncbi:MAG: hypothetical protein ACKVT2_07930 [Saprospiraceae bacterium]
MKNTFLLASFCVSLLISSLSCHKCKEEYCDNPYDPNCANYDPCLGKEQTDAEFVILDTIVCGDDLKNLWQSFEVDTCHPRDVWFRALHNNDTYEWKIGSDPRIFTEKEFSLYIDVFGDIPIRLITTKKNIFNNCFPDDVGRDTFYRTLHIANYNLIAPIYGKYLGYDEQNPLLEYTIEIKSPQSAGVYSGVYGLPEGCLKLIPPPLPSDMYESWRYGVVADRDINCFEPQGVAELAADYRTLTINYTIRKDFSSSNRISRVFIGIKQQ